MADKFYIGPYDQGSGQVTALKPFYLPEQAFSQLNNAYVYRGRTKKRPGSRLIGNDMRSSRLRVAVGTLAVPTALPSQAVGNVGQMFTVANVFFTVVTAGIAQNMLVANGSATTKTFTTGGAPAFVISGVNDSSGNPVPTDTTIYWYPGYPVMALLTRNISDINREETIAFDIRYSYLYSSLTNGWERITGGGADAIWIGDNTNYFQGTNWIIAGSQYTFFVTNRNSAETSHMRYYNGAQWKQFRPQYDNTTPSPQFINSAKFIVLFKGFLILLAPTISSGATGGTLFQNRASIPSAAQSPLDSNAYNVEVPGGGTALDAATNEEIRGYGFVKDRLIVEFERSTFELAYTGNVYYPFVWQKIDTELGVESPNSMVQIEGLTVGIGNVAIISCNGAQVKRIDDAIPQFVFDMHNADAGIERVYGIRDFQIELIYWAYPSASSNAAQPYCNKLLFYNYTNGTWGFADDSVICFGYFQQVNSDITWNSEEVTWDDDVPWDSGESLAQFRSVLAGNQQGYTFIFDPDETRNAQVISIMNMSYASTGIVTVTAIDHNMRVDEWIMIDNIESDVPDYTWNLLNKKNFKIFSVTDKDTFTIVFPSIITGTYRGMGTFERIVNITLTTKQFNLYAKEALNASIHKVDLLMDKTSVGQTTLTYATSTSTFFDNNANNTPITIETFAYPDYYPYETQATQVWRSAYLQAAGSYIQLKLSMSDEQMALTVINEETNTVSGPTLEDFELHGIIIHADRAGRLQ